MKYFIPIIFVLITTLGCTNKRKLEILTKSAEEYMKAALTEADIWLDSLSIKEYQILSDHHYPSPFNEIMRDGAKQSAIQKRIDIIDQEFGRVKERNFYGIYILLEGKILTCVPEKMKGFKQVSPRRLGVNKIEDLYKENTEGTYALLMYESLPSNKKYAEEILVMWRDENDKR